MSKNISLFWLKDDFRINRNLALIEATKNHDQVVAFTYLRKLSSKTKKLKMVGKSILLEFRKKLDKLNISPEIIKTDSYKNFFDKLFYKKNYSFIGIGLTNQVI